MSANGWTVTIGLALFAGLLLLFVGVSIGREQAAGAYDAGYSTGHADGLAQGQDASVLAMQRRNADVARLGLCNYAARLCQGPK